MEKEKLRKRENLLYREIDGEGVIYDQENMKVHSLNPTATMIWRYCDGKNTIEDIKEKILEKYDVDPDTLKEDIQKAVTDLRTLKLLKE